MSLNPFFIRGAFKKIQTYHIIQGRPSSQPLLHQGSLQTQFEISNLKFQICGTCGLSPFFIRGGFRSMYEMKRDQEVTLSQPLLHQGSFQKSNSIVRSCSRDSRLNPFFIRGAFRNKVRRFGCMVECKSQPLLHQGSLQSQFEICNFKLARLLA